MPNYCVSNAEKIIPASELSQHISTAGTEASGTSNMKFVMNGGLILGTMDGANVEIQEEVGEENIYIFGLTAHEVMDLKTKGYNPNDFINNNSEIQKILRMVGDGFFSHGDSSTFQAIYQNLTTIDHYLLMADYDSYDKMQMKVSKDYLDKKQWLKKSILNTARMGKFSSDRTIQEYADEIWKVKSQNPIKPRTITKIL